MVKAENQFAENVRSLNIAVRGIADSELYEPSEFWQQAASEQFALLDRGGFTTFKRTVNFNFHQWAVFVPWDPKLWYTFLSALRKRGLRGVVRRVESKETGEGISNRWINPFAVQVYKMYLGYLWNLAEGEDKLGILNRLTEPEVGSPLKFFVGGRLISQDLALCSIEINRMAKFIDFSKIQSVAEIGAGYGRLAYALKTLYPHLSYSIFDISKVLPISHTYLTQTLSAGSVVPLAETASVVQPGKVQCMLAHRLEEFSKHTFDLVINISSFDEMMAAQVSNYFRLIDKTARNFIYLKGYLHRSNDANRTWGLTQFPYPDSWKKLFQAPDLVQLRFGERLYQKKASP